MFVSAENGDESAENGDESRKEMAALENLGESIQSLLGSKTELTFTWGDAVRFMIKDLSSDPNSVSFQPSPTEQNVRLSEAEKLQLEEDIVKLEGELDALKAHFRQSDNKRRDTLNKILDLKGSIRVFCRMRPFLSNEKRTHPGPSIAPHLEKVMIKAGGKSKEFHFDKVFLPEASQDEVFAEVEPIIRSALDGHNVCMFAYGQTGSGKTYTMEGRQDSPGVIPRTIQELLEKAALDSTSTFTFTFSMLEVYNGCLRDLLVHRPTRFTDATPKCLSIQMDAHGGVEILNLREVVVTDFKQAIQWYRVGIRARSTAWTNTNESSSRSHCLIRIVISCLAHENRNVNTSKLWMVDLGGSERLLKTQATGQTMEEGKAINLSLSALGDVIGALQRKQSHVPYRNSRLTQILRDSLGHDSKTLMLVHISPKEDDLLETVCSLKFATRARGIQLMRELSDEAKEQRAAVMDTLMLHMKHLEDECVSAKNNMETIQFLLREKKKIFAKSDPSSENHELVQPSVGQEEFGMDAESLDCSLSDKPLGSKLPRFMAPTASSRLRGKPNDTNCISPRSGIKREKVNGKGDTLPAHVRIVAAFPKSSDIARSQSDTECSPLDERMLRRYSMPNSRVGSRFVSKQCTINESQCLSESSVMIGSNHGLRCSAMPNNKRVCAGSMSKQLCSTGDSQDSPRIGTNARIRQSSMASNGRISRSLSKKSTTDPQGKIHDGSRHSSMANNRRVSGSSSKQITAGDISQCVLDTCSPTSKYSNQFSSTEPNLKTNLTTSKSTLSNKHSRDINLVVQKGQRREAEEVHHYLKQNSSKCSISPSPKTHRKSFSDVSKYVATTETSVPETPKKTSKCDFHSRETAIHRRQMSVEYRISFNTKL
ncbi:hypothetical protein SUGI_0960390 [Cryptomeria japonica]|uniref:kinesin-like protein KIN-14U n=1 Tax=Cryptomeria japonica TaxID=3369 RepID=UPI002414B669|nr:kinesin-like protein KIN-14U [Cryptomeria japonica]GLJ45626.1 hypothetical protein SUGI_0960390 [Cryptomeria japonica]